MSSQQNGTPKIEAEAQDLNSGIQSQTKIWRTRIPEPLPLEKYPVFRLPAVLEEVIKKDFLDRQNNCNSELPVEFKSITDIITTFKLEFEDYDSKVMESNDYSNGRNKEERQVVVGQTLAFLCDLFNPFYKQLLYKTEWKNAQKQATNFARQQKKRKIEDPGYVIVEFKATEHYGFIHLLRLFTKLPNLIYGCRSGTVWTYNGLKNIFNSLTPFIQFLVENKDVFQRAVNKNPAFNSGDNDDGDMVPKPKKSRLENYENGVNLDGAPSKITKSDKDDFQQPNMRLSRKKRIAAE
ncbi:hypothetical protein L3Y34_011445 [Caenorhabditis briggsae]|uniref:MRG domain-containing protein n=1 Tax=Caenorhabditis briggsae TaxID=6238 RepID=A0AAE8ZUB0_CAEBR|nr:hypothetical protein L3Y34_011445 [Caenorhabditis briggsae]